MSPLQLWNILRHCARGINATPSDVNRPKAVLLVQLIDRELVVIDPPTGSKAPDRRQLIAERFRKLSGAEAVHYIIAESAFAANGGVVIFQQVNGSDLLLQFGKLCLCPSLARQGLPDCAQRDIDERNAHQLR